MRTENILIKFFFIFTLCCGVLTTPLWAMETEEERTSSPVPKLSNDELKNNYQYRAYRINEEINYRFPNGNAKIYIADCLVHSEHARYIAPLVYKIFSICPEKISSDIPENKLIPYVTNLIGHFAKRQCDNISDGLIIVPEIKINIFGNTVSTEQINERLNLMAHEISKNFTEEDLKNYSVKKTDFQITKPKKVSLCNRESILNGPFDSQRSTRNLPTSTKDTLPKLLYISDDYSTIIVKSKDTDRHTL